MVKSGEDMIIMPKKINWDNVLDKAWLYTKIFFATSIILYYILWYRYIFILIRLQVKKQMFI